MNSPLQIQILGSFHIIDENGSQPIYSPIQQSFLTLLLLHRDASQSRQYLSFCLWPESAEAQAQANLRTLLVRLRRVWPAIDRFIEITSHSIRWKSSADYNLDVAEFEEVIHQAEFSGSEIDLHALRLHLERAVQLYRGDLLPTCYKDWIMPERERLRQLFLQSIRTLAELEEKQNDLGSAIGHIHYLLNLEPLDETTYQWLMRLHAERGDRAGIVRSFETCAAVLKLELNIEPSPATRVMYQDLLRLRRPVVPKVKPQSAKDNLPYALTSFIGREKEISDIKRSLSLPSSDQASGKGIRKQTRATRLLTLSGPGGSGKTRLAMKVALEMRPEFPDGVWWVGLASLTDPVMVSRTIAAIFDVQESNDHSLIETISSALGSKRLLLILDNCEHLVGECAIISDHLLVACPNLMILATSRERLGLTGETVLPVPPLALPLENTSDISEQAESVQLFIDRASLTLPTFTISERNRLAIFQICKRLDGIPLAIELAAARVKVLTVDQIASRLDDRFNLLSSGNRTALPRHQTLRAMVDWSYDLLSSQEQELFRRLAVFVGGFPLEAADAVCAVDPKHPIPILETLSNLIDKSLIEPDETSAENMRYHMLETIRHYALEKLEITREIILARQRHSDFILTLVENADKQRQGAYPKKWLEMMEIELDNLRAGLEWAIEGERTELALRLVGHSAWIWVGRGRFIEGRTWLERALSLPGAASFPEPYSRTLVFCGVIAYLEAESKAAKPWLEQALAIAKVHSDPDVAAWALDFLGLIAVQEGALDLAREYLTESRATFEKLGPIGSYAQAVWHMGLVTEQEGDHKAALVLYDLAMNLFQKCADVTRPSGVLRMMGWNYYELGDRERGQEFYKKSIFASMENGLKVEAAHTLRAIAERIETDSGRAVVLLSACINVFHSLGLTTYENSILEQDMVIRQAQLDPLTFTTAWEAGRAMTLERAISEVSA